MIVVEFTYNGYTELALVLRELGMSYYIMTKDKLEYSNGRRAAPTKYWTIPKKNCHAQFGRTGKIFKLLYA